MTKKMGRAIHKVTGKTQLDWAYLVKRFPLYKEQIKAHKNDQKYLANLKTRLERIA